MGKKEDNKRVLLEAFQKNDILNTQQLMDILHTASKGTVNTYINYLRSDGHLIKEKSGPRRTKIYSLELDEDTTADYDEISTKDWQNFVILSSLSDALIDNRQVFRNSLINYILDEKELNIGLKKSSLFNRINELCNNGIIAENNNINPAALAPSVNLPVIRPLHFKDAQHIIRDLFAVSDADPFYHSITTIKSDLLELSDTLSVSENSPLYHSQGRKYQQNSIETEIYEHFGKCDYKKHVCDVTYILKNEGKTDVIRIGIGLIVYVVEKDKIYVIGKDPDKNKASFYYLLNIDRIAEVKEVRIKGKILLNPLWESREFINIFDEMLSISTEPPEEILIRFDDEYFVETRLEGLKNTRKKAVFEKKDGYIYYKDTIRGTSDLRSFLRSFTDKCVVISPERLRNEMIENTERHIKLYENK